MTKINSPISIFEYGSTHIRLAIYDEEIFISDKKKWIRDVSFPRKPKPSDQESYEKFN